MPQRRATLPVLLLLLVFLAGSGYLVYSAQKGAQRGDRGDVSFAGVLDSDEVEEPGGEWRHYDWGAAAGAERSPGSAPLRDGRIPPGPADDEVWDPQMDAMRGSYRFDGDAGVALPFDPTQRGARVVASEGALPVSPDARCQLRVLPVQAGGFNCLVRVICDGQVLYPNPTQTAGYAPCEVENGQPISAVDDGHTAADGDPLVRVDLRAGTVTVEDRGDGVDAYRATLRIGG